MVDDDVVPMKECIPSCAAFKMPTVWGEKVVLGLHPMPHVKTNLVVGATRAAAKATRLGKKTREDAGGLVVCIAEPTRVQLDVAYTYLGHIHILAKATAVVQREDGDYEAAATALGGPALYLAPHGGPVLAARGAERAFLVADHDKSTSSRYANVAFGSRSSRVGHDPTIAQAITAATAAGKTARLTKERSCAAVV